MIEIPPVYIWALIAAMTVHTVALDKYRTFDIAYIASSKLTDATMHGRMNLSTNAKTPDGKMFEEWILEQLAEEKDIPEDHGIKVLVKGWHHVKTEWRLKKWITNLYA
jgi:hypothetical protein